METTKITGRLSDNLSIEHLYHHTLGWVEKIITEDLRFISNSSYSSPSLREQAIEYCQNKRVIMTVSSLFGLLINAMAAYAGFREAFLSSNTNRLYFLTDKRLKVNIGNNDKGKVVVYSEEDKDEYHQLKKSEWVEWNGCKMILPDHINLVLSPSATWPVIFLRSNGNQPEDQITFFESQWQTSAWTNAPSKLSGNGTIHTPESLQKSGYTQSLNIHLYDFLQFQYSIKDKLEDYQITLEIPFQATFMDPLTSIRFNNRSDGKPEIQFTLGLT